MRKICSKPIRDEMLTCLLLVASSMPSCHLWSRTLTLWHRLPLCPLSVCTGWSSPRWEQFCPHTHSRHILHILTSCVIFSSQTWGCSPLPTRQKPTPLGRVEPFLNLPGPPHTRPLLSTSPFLFTWFCPSADAQVATHSEHPLHLSPVLQTLPGQGLSVLFLTSNLHSNDPFGLPSFDVWPLHCLDL